MRHQSESKRFVSRSWDNCYLIHFKVNHSSEACEIIPATIQGGLYPSFGSVAKPKQTNSPSLAIAVATWRAVWVSALSVWSTPLSAEFDKVLTSHSKNSRRALSSPNANQFFQKKTVGKKHHSCNYQLNL